MRRRLDRELRSFLEEAKGSAIRREIEVDRCLTIDLRPCDQPCEAAFVSAMSLDLDSGGWVLLELKTALEVCIAAKSRKVAPHRHRYDEWWLVLVDAFMGGIEPDDVARLRKDSALVGVQHDFAVVSIVDRSGKLVGSL